MQHFVIVYDPLEIISNNGFHDTEEANLAYLAAEERYGALDGIEVVLLSYSRAAGSGSPIKSVRHREGVTASGYMQALLHTSRV